MDEKNFELKGFWVSTPADRKLIEWKEIKKVSLKPDHFVVNTRRDKIVLQIPQEQIAREAYVSAFYTHWKVHAPELARRSAFEKTGSNKSSYLVLLGVFLLPLMGMGTIYLIDGFHTYQCDKLLETGSYAQPKFHSARKSDTGETKLKLEFTRANGTSSFGKRTTWLVSGPVKQIEDLPPLSALYSPTKDSCWDIVAGTIEDQNKVMPTLRRHFNLFFAFFFGASFILLGFLGSLWIVKLLAARRPWEPVFNKIYRDLTTVS